MIARLRQKIRRAEMLALVLASLGISLIGAAIAAAQERRRPPPKP